MTEVIRPEWQAPASVRAAVTLRSGGASVAPYDTLNLGTHVGDEPAAVAENRRRVRESLRLPSEPMWLEQVHGTVVANLDEPISGVVQADAAVTRQPGRVCVIQVADCMPVLFAARDGSAIGAAHAGWRGLANGVLESTVAAMRCDPATLVAWLGPAIGPDDFEVGDDVRYAFLNDEKTSPLCEPDSSEPAAGRHVARHGHQTSPLHSRIEAAFVRNTRQRWQCNLAALARLRLEALGITEISGGTWCTYSDRARFFSYRRDGRCGRMAALIWST